MTIISVDKLRVPKNHDLRRCGLTDNDRKIIKYLFFTEKKGIRVIARTYEKRCSRRTIQFILFPERLRAMQAQHKKEKHHLTYYNKDYHTLAMERHRQHKRELYKKGLLKVNITNH